MNGERIERIRQCNGSGQKFITHHHLVSLSCVIRIGERKEDKFLGGYCPASSKKNRF